jgi:hypothetical protein
MAPKSRMILVRPCPHSDGNWLNETTQRYNSWDAPTYVVSVKPALKEDVQKVVKRLLFYLPTSLT